jgi:hypothetical protein
LGTGDALPNDHWVHYALSARLRHLPRRARRPSSPP